MHGNLALNSNENFNNTTQTKSRMPRPKPLNTTLSKGVRGKSKGETSDLSPDRLVLGSPFGVHGVSPLTQLANNMLRDQ